MTERRFTIIDGGADAEVSNPHKSFVRSLRKYNVGSPVLYSDSEANTHHIGQVIRLVDRQSSLVFFSTGQMQIRQAPNEEWANQFPAQRLILGRQHETDADAINYLVSIERQDEKLIDNTNTENQPAFESALEYTRSMLRQAKRRASYFTGIVKTIVDEDTRDGVENDEDVQHAMTSTITVLHEEGLGTGLRDRQSGELFGYAIPSPDEQDTGSIRQLLLLHTGEIRLVTVPEVSSHAQAYQDNVPEISIHPIDIDTPVMYETIGSSYDLVDIEAIDLGVNAAQQWLQHARDRRNSRVNHRNSLIHVTDKLTEQRTTPTMSEHAERILGEDFLGLESVEAIEQYIRSLGHDVFFDLEAVPDIPYTVKDLELAKKYGEMLVFRPKKTIGTLGEEQDLTIQRMRLLLQNDQERFFRQKQLPDNHKFASSGRDINYGWSLVSRDILPGSLGVDEDQQTEVIRAYATQLANDGGSNVNVRRRSATDVVWDIVTNKIARERTLLHNVFDRTHTSAGYSSIAVGLYRSRTGLVIASPGINPYNDVGVSASR